MRFKCTHLILVAVLGLTVGCEARQGQDAKQIRDFDPALKKAADARTTARDTADADTYARYTRDDAWLVSPNGGFRLTQQNVTDLKEIKRLTGTGLASSKVSDDRYRIFGDTAIRTYRREAGGQHGEKSVKQFLETWVNQGGEWKLAAEWYRDITE